MTAQRIAPPRPVRLAPRPAPTPAERLTAEIDAAMADIDDTRARLDGQLRRVTQLAERAAAIANREREVTELPALLAAKRVAADLSVSTHQVYDLLNRGEIECRYVDGRRLVVRDSYLSYRDGLPATREGDDS